MPHPMHISLGCAGCLTPSGHDRASVHARAVHVRLPLSCFAWHESQKWVVPQQKKVAGEQQCLHFQIRCSVPCFAHTWPTDAHRSHSRRAALPAPSPHLWAPPQKTTEHSEHS